MGMTGGSERRRDRRRREQAEQRLADQQASGGFSLPELGEPSPQQDQSAPQQRSAFAAAHTDADESSPVSPVDTPMPETFVYERNVTSGQSYSSSQSYGSSQAYSPGQAPRLRASQDATQDANLSAQPSKDTRSLVDSVRAWTGANRVVQNTWADAAVPEPGAVAPGTEPAPGRDFLDKTHQKSHGLTTEETRRVAEAHNPLDDTATDQPAVSYRQHADETASIQQVPPAVPAGGSGVPASAPGLAANSSEFIDLRPYDDQAGGYFDTEPSDQLRMDLAKARQEFEVDEDHDAPTDGSEAKPAAATFTTAPASGAQGVIDTDKQLVPPVAEITHAGERGSRNRTTDADKEPAKKRPWWFYALWIGAACVAVVGWWKPGLGYEWFQGLSGKTVSTVSCKEAATTEVVQEVVTQWKHKDLNVEVVSVCEGKALLSINPLTKEQAAKAEELVKTQGRHNKSGYWMYGVPVQIRSIP